MSVNHVTSAQVAASFGYDKAESKRSSKAEHNRTIVSEEKTDKEVKADKGQQTSKQPAADQGVVYEPSTETVTDSAKKTYKPDTNLINKLKAEVDARTEQLRSLVEKMLTGQADSYNKANDIWNVLREGKFTVDPATKAQAQEDISEDGYWGVKQTSQRILDFAKALTGGDPSKMEAMRKAFEKGYKQAEKTWGGELPEISKQTYDAVMKGFDELTADTSAAE